MSQRPVHPAESPQPPPAAEATPGPASGSSGPGAEELPESPLDPELQALPEPRRPWRRTTLGVLALVALGGIGLIWGLWPPARFALWSAPPTEVGSLETMALSAPLANSWVHGQGVLSERAVEYRRPLDPDRYRLAPIAGGRRLWVELRVPEGIEPDRYVPPNSFVGRLVPLESAGLRGPALGAAMEATFGESVPADAWILFDGEAPSTNRWAIGLAALFAGFAAFGLLGIVRLLVPTKPLSPGS